MLEQALRYHATFYQPKLNDKTQLTMTWTLSDTLEKVRVTLDNGTVTVKPADDEEADVHFTLSSDTLRKIQDGSIEAFTAAGKADIREASLLDSSFGPSFSMAKLSELYHVLMHFFVTEPIKVVDLDMNKARVVHGAYAIPLFYHEGFRSAWYTIAPGQRLNEPGDTNPFDQAMVILSGSGQATFGQEVFRIEANRAYHIPAGSDHVIDNDTDEPITLIFLAYGPGA
jgi:mannose-6-phosphate isomerase-like protein (cupin superfamily)